MKKQPLTLVALLPALVPVVSAQAIESQPMSVALPTPTPLAGRDTFACRSLMDSDLTGSYDASQTKGLEDKISGAGNAVSVKIENRKTLVFLSDAAANAGVQGGSSFDIVLNTNAQLVAMYFNGTSINLFVLNKTNGLAIWSKTRSTFPGYGAPTGAMTYMACR